MLQHFKVPLIVGALLTAATGVLTAISGLPVVGVYAVAAVSVVNVIAPVFSEHEGHSTFRVPAIVGIVLTGISTALVGVEAIPSIAIYATAAAGAIHAVTPLFRYSRRLRGTTAGQKMVPKVKVPAQVGTAITVALTVCSLLAGIPGWAPYLMGMATFLQTVSGYFSYSH
jgi:hypothetical protein